MKLVNILWLLFTFVYTRGLSNAPFESCVNNKAFFEKTLKYRKCRNVRWEKSDTDKYFFSHTTLPQLPRCLFPPTLIPNFEEEWTYLHENDSLKVTIRTGKLYEMEMQIHQVATNDYQVRSCWIKGPAVLGKTILKEVEVGIVKMFRDLC